MILPTHDSGHWCRIVMDEATNALIESLGIFDLDALEIGGTRWGSVPFRSYANKNLPYFDICGEVNLQSAYDLIIMEQVLAHVVSPELALQNCHQLLRPEKYLLVTTPFLIKINKHPMDLWRWSEDGLRILLERHNFTVLTCESWGNKDCVIANLSNWTPYKKRKEHSLENDPRCPMSIWALACRN